jgi:hypothetical protein
MMKESSRDYQVVGRWFDRVVQDVKPAHLKTRPLATVDVADIEIAGDDVAARRDLPSQPLRDGAIASTYFQAAPALAQSQSLDVRALERVEQFGHQI